MQEIGISVDWSQLDAPRRHVESRRVRVALPAWFEITEQRNVKSRADLVGTARAQVTGPGILV
jgi:hypothetical protein